jgi:hypothetical protein
VVRIGTWNLENARIAVNGTPIDLVTRHLKSKLPTFPPGPNGWPRFDTTDEDERARHAVYAFSRRAAEAAAVRAAASALLDNKGEERGLVVLGDLKRRTRGRHRPDPARSGRLGGRHRRVPPRRSRRCPAVVEPGAADS